MVSKFLRVWKGKGWHSNILLKVWLTTYEYNVYLKLPPHNGLICQVSGQLQVGSDDSSGSGWRSGTVQSIRHNPLPLVILFLTYIFLSLKNNLVNLNKIYNASGYAPRGLKGHIRRGGGEVDLSPF